MSGHSKERQRLGQPSKGKLAHGNVFERLRKKSASGLPPDARHKSEHVGSPVVARQQVSPKLHSPPPANLIVMPNGVLKKASTQDQSKLSPAAMSSREEHGAGTGGGEPAGEASALQSQAAQELVEQAKAEQEVLHKCSTLIPGAAASIAPMPYSPSISQPSLFAGLEHCPSTSIAAGAAASAATGQIKDTATAMAGLHTSGSSRWQTKLGSSSGGPPTAISPCPAPRTKSRWGPPLAGLLLVNPAAPAQPLLGFTGPAAVIGSTPAVRGLGDKPQKQQQDPPTGRNAGDARAESDGVKSAQKHVERGRDGGRQNGRVKEHRHGHSHSNSRSRHRSRGNKSSSSSSRSSSRSRSRQRRRHWHTRGGAQNGDRGIERGRDSGGGGDSPHRSRPQACTRSLSSDGRQRQLRQHQQHKVREALCSPEPPCGDPALISLRQKSRHSSRCSPDPVCPRRLPNHPPQSSSRTDDNATNGTESMDGHLISPAAPSCGGQPGDKQKLAQLQRLEKEQTPVALLDATPSTAVRLPVDTAVLSPTSTASLDSWESGSACAGLPSPPGQQLLSARGPVRRQGSWHWDSKLDKMVLMPSEPAGTQHARLGQERVLGGSVPVSRESSRATGAGAARQSVRSVAALGVAGENSRVSPTGASVPFPSAVIAAAAPTHPTIVAPEDLLESANREKERCSLPVVGASRGVEERGKAEGQDIRRAAAVVSEELGLVLPAADKIKGAPQFPPGFDGTTASLLPPEGYGKDNRGKEREVPNEEAVVRAVLGSSLPGISIPLQPPQQQQEALCQPAAPPAAVGLAAAPPADHVPAVACSDLPPHLTALATPPVKLAKPTEAAALMTSLHQHERSVEEQQQLAVPTWGKPNGERTAQPEAATVGPTIPDSSRDVSPYLQSMPQPLPSLRGSVTVPSAFELVGRLEASGGGVAAGPVGLPLAACSPSSAAEPINEKKVQQAQTSRPFQQPRQHHPQTSQLAHQECSDPPPSSPLAHPVPLHQQSAPEDASPCAIEAAAVAAPVITGADPSADASGTVAAGKHFVGTGGSSVIPQVPMQEQTAGSGTPSSTGVAVAATTGEGAEAEAPPDADQKQEMVPAMIEQTEAAAGAAAATISISQGSPPASSDAVPAVILSPTSQLLSVSVSAEQERDQTCQTQQGLPSQQTEAHGAAGPHQQAQHVLHAAAHQSRSHTAAKSPLSLWQQQPQWHGQVHPVGRAAVWQSGSVGPWASLPAPPMMGQPGSWPQQQGGMRGRGQEDVKYEVWHAEEHGRPSTAATGAQQEQHGQQGIAWRPSGRRWDDRGGSVQLASQAQQWSSWANVSCNPHVQHQGSSAAQHIQQLATVAGQLPPPCHPAPAGSISLLTPPPPLHVLSQHQKRQVQPLLPPPPAVMPSSLLPFTSTSATPIALPTPSAQRRQDLSIAAAHTAQPAPGASAPAAAKPPSHPLLQPRSVPGTSTSADGMSAEAPEPSTILASTTGAAQHAKQAGQPSELLIPASIDKLRDSLVATIRGELRNVAFRHVEIALNALLTVRRSAAAQAKHDTHQLDGSAAGEQHVTQEVQDSAAAAAVGRSASLPLEDTIQCSPRSKPQERRGINRLQKLSKAAPSAPQAPAAAVEAGVRPAMAEPESGPAALAITTVADDVVPAQEGAAVVESAQQQRGGQPTTIAADVAGSEQKAGAVGASPQSAEKKGNVRRQPRKGAKAAGKALPAGDEGDDDGMAAQPCATVTEHAKHAPAASVDADMASGGQGKGAVSSKDESQRGSKRGRGRTRGAKAGGAAVASVSLAQSPRRTERKVAAPLEKETTNKQATAAANEDASTVGGSTGSHQLPESPKAAAIQLARQERLECTGAVAAAAMQPFHSPVVLALAAERSDPTEQRQEQGTYSTPSTVHSLPTKLTSPAMVVHVEVGQGGRPKVRLRMAGASPPNLPPAAAQAAAAIDDATMPEGAAAELVRAGEGGSAAEDREGSAGSLLQGVCQEPAAAAPAASQPREEAVEGAQATVAILAEVATAKQVQQDVNIESAAGATASAQHAQQGAGAKAAGPLPPRRSRGPRCKQTKRPTRVVDVGPPFAPLVEPAAAGQLPVAQAAAEGEAGLVISPPGLEVAGENEIVAERETKEPQPLDTIEAAGGAEKTSVAISEEPGSRVPIPYDVPAAAISKGGERESQEAEMQEEGQFPAAWTSQEGGSSGKPSGAEDGKQELLRLKHHQRRTRRIQGAANSSTPSCSVIRVPLVSEEYKQKAMGSSVALKIFARPHQGSQSSGGTSMPSNEGGGLSPDPNTLSGSLPSSTHTPRQTPQSNLLEAAAKPSGMTTELRPNQALELAQQMQPPSGDGTLAVQSQEHVDADACRPQQQQQQQPLASHHSQGMHPSGGKQGIGGSAAGGSAAGSNAEHSRQSTGSKDDAELAQGQQEEAQPEHGRDGSEGLGGTPLGDFPGWRNLEQTPPLIFHPLWGSPLSPSMFPHFLQTTPPSSTPFLSLEQSAISPSPQFLSKAQAASQPEHHSCSAELYMLVNSPHQGSHPLGAEGEQETQQTTQGQLRGSQQGAGPDVFLAKGEAGEVALLAEQQQHKEGKRRERANESDLVVGAAAVRDSILEGKSAAAAVGGDQQLLQADGVRVAVAAVDKAPHGKAGQAGEGEPGARTRVNGGDEENFGLAVPMRWRNLLLPDSPEKVFLSLSPSSQDGHQQQQQQQQQQQSLPPWSPQKPRQLSAFPCTQHHAAAASNGSPVATAGVMAASTAINATQSPAALEAAAAAAGEEGPALCEVGHAPAPRGRKRPASTRVQSQAAKLAIISVEGTSELLQPTESNRKTGKESSQSARGRGVRGRGGRRGRGRKRKGDQSSSRAPADEAVQAVKPFSAATDEAAGAVVRTMAAVAADMAPELSAEVAQAVCGPRGARTRSKGRPLREKSVAVAPPTGLPEAVAAIKAATAACPKQALLGEQAALEATDVHPAVAAVLAAKLPPSGEPSCEATVSWTEGAGMKAAPTAAAVAAVAPAAALPLAPIRVPGRGKRVRTRAGFLAPGKEHAARDVPAEPAVVSDWQQQLEALPAIATAGKGRGRRIKKNTLFPSGPDHTAGCVRALTLEAIVRLKQAVAEQQRRQHDQRQEGKGKRESSKPAVPADALAVPVQTLKPWSAGDPHLALLHTSRGGSGYTRKSTRVTAVNHKGKVDWDRLMAQDRPPLIQMKSSVHGFGMFAAEDFGPHQFVIEYRGELIPRALADLREKQYWETHGTSCMYLFSLTGTPWVIDATRKGNVARYINHCCEPNCTAVDVEDMHGVRHIGIYTLEHGVKKGEEVTYDYMLSYEEGKQPAACFCNKPRCTGRMDK